MVIGNLADSVVYSTSDPKGSGIFAKGGSAEDWQEKVGLLCIGNSRLLLSACAGLSSPLLHLLNLENGGFHIYGASSTGKSTAGLIYASIWGSADFIQQWRTTSNALESIAERHNDTGLVMDELAQIDPHMAGEVAYMLGNGQGKARANRNGESKEVYIWRVIFFSTGEITLSDHITSTGGRVMAGQEVRLINIPADSGANMGVFENIHEADNPAAFAGLIKENTGAYFGHAGPALVELLVPLETRAAYLDELHSNMHKFITDNLPNGSSGQAIRVANRFALLAAVGEFAISHGILPWPPGEANRGIGQCFKAWLDDRDGAGDAEVDQAIAQVRNYLELHGEARFTSWTQSNDDNSLGNTRDRIGFRKTTEDRRTQFYILPEAWKSQVCRGLNSRRVTAILLERGLLVMGPDGSATRSERLPGMGTCRVYVISPDILGSSH